MKFRSKRLSRFSVFLYVIAGIFVVVGIFNTVDAYRRQQKYGEISWERLFDYIAAPTLIAVFVVSLGIGLQHLFDIRNHILADKPEDSDA